MSGGGIKSSQVYRETDEMLHTVGLEHERLNFKFQGLDQRLTGVEPAKVVKELFA